MSTRYKMAPSDVTTGETTVPILGRRHRAKSADQLRSRTRSSDRLSTITTTTTYSTTSSCATRDLNPDRTSYSFPGGLNAYHDHHHHHRLYHSEQDINHHHHHHHHHEDPDQPRRRRRRKHRPHQHPDHHHHHSSHSSLPSSSLSSSSSSRHTAPRSRSVPGREDRPTADTLNLSLCGCGFLGVYHLGVITCLLKHGPSLLARLDRVAGTSAGALAAALLVTSPSLKSVEASTEIVESLAKSIRRKPLGALTPGFHMSKHMARLLDKVLPPDAHELARGKLHVSVTDVKTKENVVMSQFKSRQELIETLVASCHIPVYSGSKMPCVRGKHYCDGGMSNNLVTFRDGRTITVSPFSGKQDIGPRDALDKGTKGFFCTLHNHDLQINLNNIRRLSHAFFPPRHSILQQYFELGHKDAGYFLVREGLYEITMPTKKPMVYESSV